jgi:pre-mRNA-splicing factor 38A
MPKREVLEDLEVLEPRISPLGDIEQLLEEDDVEEIPQREHESDEEGVAMAENDDLNGRMETEPAQNGVAELRTM